MKSRITTKHALFSSVMSLFLCVAMLIGSTFAWFTDTASTGVNKIEAGTLKVDIVNENDESIKGDSMSFVNAKNEANILWEPGVTFKTTGFKIVSTGTLALKYKLALNGVTGDTTTTDGKRLLDVITFSVVKADGTAVDLDSFEGKLTPDAAESEVLYIQGHMAETANNDYQGLTLEGLGITVQAAQMSYEVDSKDNTYDSSADYPEVQLVTSTDELKDALASNESNGKTLKLYDDITDAGSLTIAGKNIALDLNGNSIDTTKLEVKNSTIVITDTSENTDGTINTSDSYGVINATNSNVTIEGGKFTSTYNKSGSSGYAGVIQARNSNLTINGGYFENTDAVGSYNYLIKVPAYGKNEQSTITINGGEFVSHRSYGYVVTSDRNANVDVVINGGKFTTHGGNSYLTNVGGNVIVNDCEFVATGNNTVFDIPENSTVTVKGGTFSVNEKAYSDTSLAGLIFHRKTTGWTNVKGTLLVDPTTPVKVNQPTYSGFIAAGATQSANKGADGFYTISK